MTRKRKLRKRHLSALNKRWWSSYNRVTDVLTRQIPWTSVDERLAYYAILEEFADAIDWLAESC